MNAQIIELLSRADMSAAEMLRVLQCRREVLYAELVRMEAAGLVSVWGRQAPKQSLWCLA